MKLQKGKFARLFSRYPPDALLRPGLFEKLFFGKQKCCSRQKEDVFCIQGVPNKLYFLLFGLMRNQLSFATDLRAELLVVRALNGAIGTGWFAFLKRRSVLAWWWSRQWERAYGSMIQGVAYRSAALFQPLDDLKDWFKSNTIWMHLKNQEHDFSMVINGVQYGDLVVDSYLRYMPSPRFDANSPFVRQLIWQVLRDVRQAEHYFGKIKPKFYLSSYSTYIEHGVAIRIALKYNVPVWTFADLGRFGKRLNSEDVYHTTNTGHYRAVFNQLDRQEDRLAEAEERLSLRLSGGADPATSYMRQSAYGENKTALPTDLKGAVVVFLHDFYDSPHIYPELVFCDFWRWICFTIETLQASGVTFYIKPHPNQIALSEVVLSELRALYPDVDLLSTNVNNAHLAQEGISCGVTVYGTVAHELAYLGVPSIGCSKHPHHSFDFCRTAKTLEEYKIMLETPQVVPIEVSEMRRQALMFYYMHNLYGTPDELALRQACSQLWYVCCAGEAKDDEVLSALKHLSDQRGFQTFINDLVKSGEVD